VDVKFLERIAGSRRRLYQFTAIDDCTRIRVLKIYDTCNQASAIRFVNDVVRRLPFRVLVIQTDNGAEFQSRFHRHLEEQDIRHVYIRPRTPHVTEVLRPYKMVMSDEDRLLSNIPARVQYFRARSCSPRLAAINLLGGSGVLVSQALGRTFEIIVTGRLRTEVMESERFGQRWRRSILSSGRRTLRESMPVRPESVRGEWFTLKIAQQRWTNVGAEFLKPDCN